MNKDAQPCLVIDGSARSGVSVGILSAGRWLAESTVEQGALEATTDLAAAVLKQAGLSFRDIQSYAVCVGPGSILGVRVSAMAVRTWATVYHRPIYVWESLTVLAQVALDQGQKAPFAVIAESRLKRWNYLEVNSEGQILPASELELEQVMARGLHLVVKTPSPYFPTATVVESAWKSLPQIFERKEFLRLEPKPDALNPAADYALWSGERHRGNP